MDKIKITAPFNPLKQPAVCCRSNLVPAHVRYLVLLRQVKLYHFTLDNAQPLVETVFFTRTEEQLQTQTYAQQGGLFFYYRTDHPIHTVTPQVIDGIGKSAHTGQNHLVSRQYILGTAADTSLISQLGKSILYTGQITHTVIYNSNQPWSPFPKLLRLSLLQGKHHAGPPHLYKLLQPDFLSPAPGPALCLV